MKKGRLRKRGNPEAARRALAAATSGESSAAQLPRSGLPLGVPRELENYHNLARGEPTQERALRRAGDSRTAARPSPRWIESG